MTVLDRLVQSIRGRDVPLDGQERPAAILWTDPKAEWRSIVELLQERLGELLMLGSYKPESRTGPAIWIRCVIDRALDSPSIAEGHPPIVYLPDVSRQDLRSGDECRADLKPLVELMYRGTMWLQHNGSDWTVLAFLTSTKALGLDIARDQSTLDALLRALPDVALTPVSQLARRLEADDFDRMLAEDVPRDLLRWMCDPAATKARLGPQGWAAFRSRCRDELHFDPEADADVVAGERLAAGDGAWAGVWSRFAESPTGYAEIARLLRRCRPQESLRFDRERWPDLNEQDEDELRKALAGVTSRSHAESCDEVARLELGHGMRRRWVWSRLGLSPLAVTLEPLARLAVGTMSALGGNTPADVASAYLERGWQADAAAWEAMATCTTADRQVVMDVTGHLLGPWLEDSARAFQAAVARAPLPGRGQQAPVLVGDDVCILFADGLRYDLARHLAARLEGRGCRIEMNYRWAAVPTVTATAKPAVTPVAEGIVGGSLGQDFAPTIASSGRPASAANLRDAMRGMGYQILGDGTFDVPTSHPARGWLESGEIDSLGHKLGVRLARQIPEELDRLAERVVALLDAGWRQVRLVTDHGWLLLPGGLPKVDLPKHLTASRWSRCAVIAGGSSPSVDRAPWHWNPAEWFATAPGSHCFNKTEEYAHGGLSIQECLTPDMVVERAGGTLVAAAINSVTWRGLRCFVVASTRGAKVLADIRLDRPSGRSVVQAKKDVEADGSVSLVLAGDEHEESALVLVLLDDTERILAHRATRVGVDS